jgi:hypothetical protein
MPFVQPQTRYGSRRGLPVMAIDLGKLDQQIRDLMELRRIASNPAMAELLESLISRNGAKRVSHSSLPDEASLFRQTETNAKDQDSLTETVKKVCASFGHDFTLPEVRKKMDEMKFVFTAQNPDVGIGTVVRRMRDKGEVHIVRRGSGRKPHVLRYQDSAKAPAD